VFAGVAEFFRRTLNRWNKNEQFPPPPPPTPPKNGAAHDDILRYWRKKRRHSFSRTTPNTEIEESSPESLERMLRLFTLFSGRRSHNTPSSKYPESTNNVNVFYGSPTILNPIEASKHVREVETSTSIQTSKLEESSPPKTTKALSSGGGATWSTTDRVERKSRAKPFENNNISYGGGASWSNSKTTKANKRKTSKSDSYGGGASW
jgi:hypothetical protein